MRTSAVFIFHLLSHRHITDPSDQDFQARKRITELKLLVQGLQSALLQMRDSMKVSPSIDLGYKVVRLDQLVESTGFGQKVDNGGECRGSGREGG